MSNVERDLATAIAEKITTGFAQQDVEAFASVYSQNITIWHSHDGADQDRAGNLAMLGQFFSGTKRTEYRDVRRTMTERGIIQQHVVYAHLVDDREVEMPACLILIIEDGSVQRIEEYCDPSPMIGHH